MNNNAMPIGTVLQDLVGDTVKPGFCRFRRVAAAARPQFIGKLDGFRRRGMERNVYADVGTVAIVFVGSDAYSRTVR